MNISSWSQNRYFLIIIASIILGSTLSIGAIWHWQEQKLERQQQYYDEIMLRLENDKKTLQDHQNILVEKGMIMPQEWCSLYECLFADGKNIMGTTILEGYYSETNEEEWGTKSMCENLIITQGSASFIEHLKVRALGRFSEGENKDPAQNKERVHILFDQLPEDMVQEIKKSTAKNPVSLRVLREQKDGVEGKVCHPDVAVLGIAKNLSPKQ